MQPAFLAKITDIRRTIHAHPELGFEEYGTQKLVRDELLAAGVPEAAIRTCAKTGLVVDIIGTGPVGDDGGLRLLAIRADMDALPLTETSGLPYASTVPGKAHSCGHDGHVASALGAALLLFAKRHELPANRGVRFLFQPAEEGPGGAKPMIAEGCLEGVSDGVFGFHNLNLLPLGSIWIQPGAASSHCCDIEIVVTGKGGHASMPHVAKDPLLAAASIVTAINTIVSRNISAHSAGVVSICCFQSGTATNVIPDTATLKGTIRDFEPTVGATLLRRVKEIVAGVCEAFGVSGEVIASDSYPSIINSEEPTTFITELCEDLFGPANVLKHVAPMTGGEDFSYFGQKVPGCFVFIGGGTPDTKCPTIHQAGYDFSDGILPIAMGLWVRLTEARFGVTLYPDSSFFSTGRSVAPSELAAFKKAWLT